MVRSQRIFTGSGSSQKLRLRSAPAPQHWVPVLHITRVVDPCHLCGSGSIFHSNRFWSKRFSSNFIKQKVNFLKLFKYLFIHYFLCFCCWRWQSTFFHFLRIVVWRFQFLFASRRTFTFRHFFRRISTLFLSNFFWRNIFDRRPSFVVIFKFWFFLFLVDTCCRIDRASSCRRVGCCFDNFWLFARSGHRRHAPICFLHFAGNF